MNFSGSKQVYVNRGGKLPRKGPKFIAKNIPINIFTMLLMTTPFFLLIFAKFMEVFLYKIIKENFIIKSIF